MRDRPAGQTQLRRPARERARALAVTLTLAPLILAATAQALPDVGEEQGGIADTPHSPRAKDPPSTVSFTQVAGAQWEEGVDKPTDAQLVEGSPTSVDVDFHAVASRDEDFAFAAGSVEADGDRRPTLYRFTTLDGWQPETTFPPPGYIAALAWLDDERALAVGGDGTYPERERDDGTAFCNPAGTPPAGDQAGRARAFLYTEGEGWRELRQLPDGEEGDELPDAMSALTAADAYLPPPPEPGKPAPPAFAIAAGLCQLWHWVDTGFERDVSGWKASNRMAAGQTPPSYRIRDVSFAEPLADPFAPLDPEERRPRAYAVTSGCCLDSEVDPLGALNGQPETLSYTVPAGKQPHEGSWAKQTASAEPRITRPDTHVSVTATQTGLRANGQPAVNQGASSSSNSDGLPGTVTSPGGPFDANEPTSHVAGRSVGAVSSVWLADGDGDIGGGMPRTGVGRVPGSGLGTSIDAWDNNVATAGWKNGHDAVTQSAEFGVRLGGFVSRMADGVPDWSVGELTASGRAVAYGTDPDQMPSPRDTVDPLVVDRCVTGGSTVGTSALPTSPGCPVNSALVPVNKTLDGEPPTGADRVEPTLASSRVLGLASYGLNAIEIRDAQGAGWAVGNHGAIVRFQRDPDEIRGRRGQQGGSAKAPPAALAEREAWSSLRPPGAGEPGLVPPLSERPPVELERPELVPAAGPVPMIASADGRYGWSLRQRRVGTFGHSVWDAVAYLDNGTWHQCEGQEDASAGPVHPACESFEALRAQGIELDGWVKPTVVPMRTDADPTNDEEFELAAITSSSRSPIARFRDGRWQPEAESSLGDLAGKRTQGPANNSPRNTQIAFTAPDDGIVIAGNNPIQVFRFDGTRWSDCTSACDPDGLLPDAVGFAGDDARETPINLLAAGESMFAYGSIYSAGLGGRQYPYILVRGRRNLAFEASAPGAYYPLRDPNLVGMPDQVAVFPPKNADATGWIEQLAIAQDAYGSLQGLALGSFQQDGVEWSNGLVSAGGARFDALRLQPDGSWQPERSRGALADDRYTPLAAVGPSLAGAVVTGGDEPASFVALPHTIPSAAPGPQPQPSRIYRFDEARERWVIEATGYGSKLTPDGEGGFFVERNNFVHRYTDHPPEPVFAEVPRPALPPRPTGSRIVQLAAAADGTVWAATDSDQLFRYERALGWDRVQIPGWDPGRIVTSPSSAFALSLSPAGSGLVVGSGGRIAKIEPGQVQLDPASQNGCDPRAPIAPCGTNSDLHAVAVAPDGSALVAGEDHALLWRPAGGELRAIQPPGVSANTSFSSVGIADESTLWVVAEGRVYRAGRSGANWRWELENTDSEGELQKIEQVALDSDGQGFGIGGANIYERVPGAQPLWRKLHNPSGHALSSIALPAGGGEGALIGGAGGLILTWTPSGFAVAKPAQTVPHDASDVFAHPINLPIVALALAPGVEPGQVEAWGLSGVPSGGLVPLEGFSPVVSDPWGARSDIGRLFHFSSDPDEPLLGPGRGLSALSDTPARSEGEIAFAAFGKSDCQVTGNEICTEIGRGEEYADQVVDATVEEIAARKARGELDFALWSGDAVDEGSYAGHQLADSAAGATLGGTPGALTGGIGLRKLRRWGELVPDRLADLGVPTFGTIGAQDLSGTVECQFSGVAGIPEWESCKHRKEARAGENLGWRAAMAERDAPWGDDGELQGEGLIFERVADGGLSLEHEDQQVETSLPLAGKTSTTIAAGGAPTHYAIDAYRTEGEGTAAVRLVFADTSQGSLSASDLFQQPFEPDGQTAWLERVLCFSPERTATGERCTREPAQRAIVVTNTPTYSYGPGALRETQPDLGVAFESILMRYDVDVVISGRIGWNGRYWATAPGVHYPCPGAAYTDRPPSQTSACGQEAPAAAGAALPDPAKLTGDATGGIGDPLAFVVASGAGGKFADGQGAHQGDTADGFWHGYTVVRLDLEGEREPIVEQRPVYEWIGIEASDRVLLAREKLRLRGFGRGPVGYNERGSNFSPVPLARYDTIDSTAVTHRYELLAANPARPWVPKLSASGPCAPYACLPENIATIDRITGEVKAGNGKYPDTFAVATLSVGEHVASYPLLFRRSPSFVVNPIGISAPVPGAPIASPNPPQPPSPPNPPAPNVPQPGAPQIPAPLGVPPIAASQPPEPQPPAPPAPPPPVEQLSPLNLALAPPGLTIATPTAVIQPPTPPVNPAPPGGARREARQRQAAAQKSGADNDGEESVHGDAREYGGDQVQGRASPDQAFRRHDRARPERSFTPLARADDQPSAWAQGALYSGGIALMAFALAAGWSRGRPTPRSRPPELPAPALARMRSRREN